MPPAGAAPGAAPGAARRPTRPGDWFLTAHSNLAGAHLVFHLAVLAAAARSEGEEKGGVDAEGGALAGVTAILAAAGAAGASGVALPLLLDPPDGALAAGQSQPTAGTVRSPLPRTDRTSLVPPLVLSGNGAGTVRPCARRAAGGR